MGQSDIGSMRFKKLDYQADVKSEKISLNKHNVIDFNACSFDFSIFL